MKPFLTAAFGLLFMAQAQAIDIEAALQLGQRVRLDACEQVADDAPQAKALRDSFAKVQQARAAEKPVALRVARCAFAIQVLAGEVIVHPDIASWSEGERLFVLAHELGHIEHGDWHQFVEAFKEAVPASASAAEVPAYTRRLQPRLRELMYDFEYGADEYAVELMAKMGRDAVAYGREAILRIPAPPGSPTHPSSAQRISRLRTLSAGKL